MKDWEKFEIDATKHLNDTFGDLAEFSHQGGADSTNPDILVKTRSGNEFYIEAKLSNAQCGQFVLQPDIPTSTFIYTAKNEQNEYANKITEYMNRDFESFKEAGTAGKEIIMEQSIFANWIKTIYSGKNVKWFISENFILIPIEELHNYFNIKAVYRVKRSGSSDVGKRNLSSVVTYIKTLEVSNSIIDYTFENAKLFVTSNNNIHNKRFVYNGYEYMFSERANRYEVRKLSNTFNANVIFSVSLKNKADKYQEEFVSFLKG